MKRVRTLYLQVLVAVACGALVGWLWPSFGEQLKPLGDGFIKLIKMLIAPIIFCTVVTGIGHLRDLKQVGRVGLKAIVYFEVLSTAALAIGLVVGELLRPGSGIHADVTSLDSTQLEAYSPGGHSLSAVDFLLNVIPNTVVDAFAKGEILQVLLISMLFGLAAARVGEPAAPLIHGVDRVMRVLFQIVNMVMRLAPLGAFGAMGFAVGKYGIATLLSLGQLILCFYVTSALFVVIFLGLVCRWVGVSLFSFLRYIREEIFIVLGTSSSETVLPRMLEKMEALGCSKSVVGITLPMGYSFNLDGTSIYLTLATLFVAQALHIHVSLGEELALLGVLLLSSKGAAAVTGGGFITLAATLSSTGHIPVAGLSLLIGVDRFMSEARAITNVIGNGVATLAIARWEGELDLPKARARLMGEGSPLETADVSRQR